MKSKIFVQHAEHTKWLSELAFYRDEIKLMQNRIDEVLSKNTSKEVALQVEHFQNQLLIQENNAVKIQHLIKHSENAIENSIKDNPTAVDHRVADDHKEEREMIKSFENHFKELRTELNLFLLKWM